MACQNRDCCVVRPIVATYRLLKWRSSRTSATKLLTTRNCVTASANRPFAMSISAFFAFSSPCHSFEVSAVCPVTTGYMSSAGTAIGQEYLADRGAGAAHVPGVHVAHGAPLEEVAGAR